MAEYVLAQTAGLLFLVLGLTVAFLLLRTVRPTVHWHNLRVDGLDTLCEKSLLYYGSGFSREEFLAQIEAIKLEPQQEAELQNRIYVRHQLLERKYRRYRCAFVLAKGQVLLCGIALGAFLVVHFAC